MYRVLLADDEPFILEGLRHIINWNEYELEITAQAINGIEAVNILENSSIHILITDIKMPEMDGIELIKYIKEKEMNVKCIVLSGYDDFTYVKEAAVLGIENYLLKPVDIRELIPTLQNTLTKIENELYNKIQSRKGSDVLRENILNRWVSGYINEDELVERASFLGINLNCKNMRIGLIKPLVSSNDESTSKISDKNLLRFAINNIASQIMEENKCGIAFEDLDGDIVLLFTSLELDLSKELIENVLSQCIQNIQTYITTRVFITVGNLIEKFTAIEFSYKNAKILQDYSFIYPENHIVQYEDTIKNLSEKDSSLHIDTTPLKYSVTSKDKDTGIEFIQKIYDNFMENENITPAFIRNYTIEVLFTITSTIKSVKASADELPDEFRNLLSSVSEMKSVNEIKNWLCDIFVRCIDFLNDEEEKLSPTIRKLLNYIQANYSKDMNLKTLASDFNISSIYLGQLFKNELGDTFTNYLNKIRIDQAKTLLQSTNMKVNEISERVGYQNTNYFFTIFKKITGVSPVEFRR